MRTSIYMMTSYMLTFISGALMAGGLFFAATEDYYEVHHTKHHGMYVLYKGELYSLNKVGGH